MAKRIDLLSNESATGSAGRWPGGKGTYCVVGTFSGATVALEYLGPDGTTWVSVGAEAELTAAGMVTVEFASGQVRAAVTGGSPSGLYATLVANGN